MIHSRGSSAVLALAHFFFFCFSIANAEETSNTSWVSNPSVSIPEETGNILGNTAQDWNGNVTTCYSSGCWGGTSGGSSPSFSSDGAIRFGYVGSTLSQSIAIQNVLEANAGLSLDGYRWSWRLKNADANYESTNGARGQDPLVVTVSIYDNNNQVVDERTFDYSYHINTWTYFSGVEWFKSSYLADDLNSVQLEVYGKDAGFWAGWYGPEFDSYDIRLLYTVDACISDPLSDTNCPGYELAYTEMMCTSDALYDSTCPGYQEAYALANIVSQDTSNSNSGDVADVASEGGVSNTGEVDVETIANSGITEQQVEEVVTVVEDTNTQQGTNVVDDVIQQEAVQQAVTEVVEETQQESVAEVVAEVVEDPQQESLEKANSLDLENMSPRDVLNALTSLGILGNETTNGVGDPTGLGGSVDGSPITNDTASSSPLPDVVSNSISQSSSAMTGSSDGTTSNDDGSYSSTESTIEISSAASLPNAGVPDNMSASDFGVQSDGSYSMLAEIDGAVYQVTLATPEVSQNPLVTGGDASRDLNSIFGGPELIADNTQVTAYAEEQNSAHESFAKRMLRDRIRNINQPLVTQSGDMGEADEKYVQKVTEESYEESDALSESDVSQAEVVAEMNTNEEFDAYREREIEQVEFYAEREIYPTTIPENRRGLRNGLAQQLLWDKMVEEQYKR
jgi:hypothetical protein